jgi:hypothetical protein
MNNGKGWALVLRADGTQSTFGYDSAHWTTGSTLNPDGYMNGTNSITEYKSALFSSYPYSELRLGMRIDGKTNWLEVKHGQYASMQAAMNSGRVTFSGTTRNDWLALANNGALQWNCLHAGYNFVPSLMTTFHVRIGMVADEDFGCANPDSFVGIGSKCLVLQYASLSPDLLQGRITASLPCLPVMRVSSTTQHLALMEVPPKHLTRRLRASCSSAKPHICLTTRSSPLLNVNKSNSESNKRTRQSIKNRQILSTS